MYAMITLGDVGTAWSSVHEVHSTPPALNTFLKKSTSNRPWRSRHCSFTLNHSSIAKSLGFSWDTNKYQHTPYLSMTSAE